MRILKIMLLSTALAAFGTGTALANTAPLATTPGEADTTKPTVTKKKIVKKHALLKKKIVKAKKPLRKKAVIAKASKKKPATPDTEAAPGNPPGSSTN